MKDDSPLALDATTRDKPAAAETVFESTSETARPGVPAQLVAGSKVGRYAIVNVLGSGGMGIVYRAFDPQLGRPIALKVVRPSATSEQTRARLVREAQAMAKVAHPNVIAVHDAGTIDDQVFIAMELVEGEDLATWLAGKPRSWREVLAMFEQAGRGLAAAHAVGLVHRDFKPLNVLVGRDGRVRVLDFGLARPIDDRGQPDALAVTQPELEAPASLTRTGVVVGTPLYMAPEQHAGGDTDARTDQFAFCVALHHALYGRFPFPGTSMPELMIAVMEGKPVAPPATSRVPSWLRRIVLRGLSVRPDARFPSMDTLLAEVSAAIRRRRRRRVAIVAIAGIVLAGAGVTILFATRRPANQMPPFANAKQQQITFTGHADNPAFSADGKYLAYSTGEGETSQLVVQDLASGEARTVLPTHQPSRIRWSSTGRELTVRTNLGLRLVRLDGSAGFTLPNVDTAWSPDGSELVSRSVAPDLDWAFYDARSGAQRLVHAPIPGARRVMSVDWSAARGLILASVVEQPGSALWTMKPDGSELREIYRSVDEVGQDAQWSPNGERIYFQRTREEVSELAVLAYDASTGSAHEQGIALAGTSFDGVSFAIAPDEHTIVLSRVSARTEIVAVTDDRRTTINNDTESKSALATSPDQTSIAFASGSGTRMRIRVLSLETGSEVSLPSATGKVTTLAWSPGGDELAYVAMRGQQPELWRVVVATGRSTRIAAITNVDGYSPLVWSSRNTVVYLPIGSAFYVVMDLATGQQHRLTDDPTPFGQLIPSPDHRQLVARGASLWLISLADGKAAQLYTEPLQSIGWSPDASFVYLADLAADLTRIYKLEIATRRIHAVTTIPGDANEAVVAGDRIVLATSTTSSDLWAASITANLHPLALPTPIKPLPPPPIATHSTPTNLGMEDGSLGGAPDGWSLFSGTRVALVDRDVREGKQALSVESIGFGQLDQRFDATSYRGKRIRFRAQMRSDTKTGLAIKVIVAGKKTISALLDFDASPAWQPCEVVADIRPDADLVQLSIGVDTGHAWVDDGSIEIVDR